MNTDIDLVDFMDLINYTLHKDFVEKWRYKYSEKFIKHFQIKILESLNKQKILKKQMKHLRKAQDALAVIVRQCKCECKESEHVDFDNMIMLVNQIKQTETKGKTKKIEFSQRIKN